jgi:hypothetical protein
MSLLDARGRDDIGFSRESYVLSLASPHNVKIRNGRLEIKHLVATDATGLELWHPVLSSDFPLDRIAIQSVWAAWRLPLPLVTASRYTHAAFLQEIRNTGAALSRVDVEKRRTRLTIATCEGEHVSLAILGHEWESIAFENVDPLTVWNAVEEIGLRNAEITNYPAALKRLAGLTQVSNQQMEEL